MTRSIVWINGGLTDPDSAVVSWSDHGLTVGDGVFETIELRAGTPFALSRHLARLDHSANGLGLEPPTPDAVRAAVAAVAGAWGDEPGRLRITYTAGPGPAASSRGSGSPTLIVAAAPMRVRAEPTSVITVPFTRNERSAVAGLKTTSYAENVTALALAEAAGASEAIFANTRDELCEGTGSNIFVGVAGRLHTPPLSSGCLAGITRELLLEALADRQVLCEETTLALSDLAVVDEAFLVSTTRHVQPISHLDERALAQCPGPLTTAASRVWHESYDELLDP